MSAFVDLRMYLCFLLVASPLGITAGQRDDGYKYLHYGSKSVPENVKVSATASKRSNVNEVSILVKPYPFKVEGKEVDFKINDLLCAADCQLVRVVNMSTEKEGRSTVPESEHMAGRPFSLSTLKDWCRENCNEKATWPKADAAQEEAKATLGKRQNPEPSVKEEQPEGYFAPAQYPKNRQIISYKPVPGQVPVFPKHWKKIEAFPSILPIPMSVFSSIKAHPAYSSSERPTLRFYPGPARHEPPTVRNSVADVGYRFWGGGLGRRSFPVPARRPKIIRFYPLRHSQRRGSFICTSCRGGKETKYENEEKPVREAKREEKREESDREDEEDEEEEEEDYEEIDEEESECEEDGSECSSKEVFLRFLKEIYNLLSDETFRAMLEKTYCKKGEGSTPEEKTMENATIPHQKRI